MKNYIMAGIVFALVPFNIYWGITYNNPGSFLAAVICFVAGIMNIMVKE